MVVESLAGEEGTKNAGCRRPVRPGEMGINLQESNTASTGQASAARSVRAVHKCVLKPQIEERHAQARQRQQQDRHPLDDAADGRVDALRICG